MIIVFVIDTSPSMGKPLGDTMASPSSPSLSASLSSPSSSSASSSLSSRGMSRLDLSKMAVEEIVRGLKKRMHEHNFQLQQAHPHLQEAMRNVGLGFAAKDEFLLLSTGRQYMQQPGTAACGAGGRLLVGFGGDHLDSPMLSGSDNNSNSSSDHQQQTPGPSSHHGVDAFQRELKRLKATEWDPNSSSSSSSLSSSQHQQLGIPPESKQRTPFPEDGGGAAGLNAALSAGLQMLSRYRLRFKATENFAMGRLPTPAVLNPSGGGPATQALQPACLVLITDGACLRSPPSEGGGSLKLQSSSLLREFYQEPFRWDQRIFCLGVGARDGTPSTQFFHPHLRALCEVTGGSHMMLRSSGGSLSQFADFLVKLMCPPRPRDLPLPDPIQIPPQQNSSIVGSAGTFVNAGPVCTFQALEPDMDSGQPPTKHRALILYVPHSSAGGSGLSSSVDDSGTFQTPIWCLPEMFFPNKKLDTLPARPAQPNLLFSRYPARLGSKCFEASSVMKSLHRLDQLVLANRNFVSQPVSVAPQNQPRLLKRDVYICEWISVEGKGGKGPASPQGMEYFPVLVAGAGRPTLSDGDGNYLSIGILHIPQSTSTLSSSLSSGVRLSTLTLLPPEPHVLLPLLIRAADAEHRALKKVASSADGKDPGTVLPGSTVTGTLSQKQAGVVSRNTHLDESWRNEFRAYMFRLPPYYSNALKWTLRTVLPASVHSLLNTEGSEGVLSSQCYSKICMLKIRNAEQMAKSANERLERQEVELRRRGMPIVETARPDSQQSQIQLTSKANQSSTETWKPTTPAIRYGQYDPRTLVDSYLSALRNMPAPWRVTGAAKGRDPLTASSQSEKNIAAIAPETKDGKRLNAVDILGDLPAKCLMAYYESRRRWIFGGSGLATRGLFVEGVHNDGSNVQHCGAKRDKMKESLISFAGVGVSQLNETTTAKMGDYRERLLWSRAPVVGSGANDSMGVSATTSQNGAPVWSVDDDAMPITFFDARTGEFADSVQARVRSRLLVNFGNPYKDKRADSLIPEEFLNQRPKKGMDEESFGDPLTPPSSPPHDDFSATEGEGEAVFAGKPLARRKSPRRTSLTEDEHDDEKSETGKRLKLDPDNLIEQPCSSNDTLRVPSPTLTPKGQPPPPPPKPDTLKEERQSTSPPQPRPPLSKRQSSVPLPPPPPKGAPRRGSLPRTQSMSKPTPNATPPTKPPVPPSASAAVTSQKRPPPPPPNQSPSVPLKPPHRPLAPAKAPPPPPASKQVEQQVSQPVTQQASQQVTQQVAQQSKIKSLPQVPQDSGLDLQSPDKRPNVSLPPGWICVWSKSQKRWYFFDTKTNKSLWQWPPP